MNLHNKQADLNHLYTQRKILVGTTIFSLAMCLLLSMSTVLLIGREKTIIVPAVTQQSFWIDGKGVSDSYMEQMADYFVGLVLNANTHNVQNRSDRLLEHVHSAHYAALKAQLLDQNQELMRRAMSTSFYAQSYQINQKELTAEVQGELHVAIASESIVRSAKRYQLKFSYQQGRLWLTSFKEINHV